MAEAKDKLARFQEFMKGDHALVHLDSTANDVEVPDHLKGNSSLTLKLSYLFQGETTTDEQGVVTYLKFSGNYFRCFLPWTAIWGLTGSDQKQLIWVEDLPPDLLVELAKEQVRSFASKVFGRKEKKDDKEHLESSSGKRSEAPEEKKIVEDEDDDWGAVPAFLRRSKK